MGISYTTVCTRCSVDAPEVGDFGYIGLPSLDTKRTKKHTQPFGYLYAGLAALSLLTEEIEAFHAFLQEHRGHPLRQFSDADGEDLEDEGGGDEQDDVAPAPTNTRKFVFKKGKFVEAFHEVACEACKDVQRGSESARLRPFAARTLTKDEATLFQTNCDDLDSNVHRVGGFPYDDVAEIARFLRRHAGHAIVVRLDEGEKSAQPKALRAKASAPPSWTPPQWAPQEHEESLGRSSDPEARTALLRLRHRDPAARAEALAKLRELADPATFGHVATMWRDPEPNVRAAAQAVIGALDDPRKARVLGHALLDESDAVRSAAEAALRDSKLDPARAAAIAATPRAPDTRPEPKKLSDDLKTLREALLDPSSSVRSKAVEQLAKHSERDATDALLEALADPGSYVRRETAEGLVRHGSRDPRVVPALIGALHDYSDGVVWAAVKALGQLKVEQAVPLILERLLASAYYSDGVEALEAIGSPAAIGALGAALAHPSLHARGAVVYALSKLKGAGVAQQLVKALADEAEEVRAQASYALGERKSTEAVAALVAGYARPSEWDRRSVVEALGQLGGPEALRVLVAALRDRSKVVRAAAAAGLAKQDDARGNRALVSAARRGDAHVAGQAWQYLLGQGEPGTEQALADAMPAAEDGATTMAASFLRSGNALLAKRARSWLSGSRAPQSAPKIKWGSRRGVK